jgi:hypothetical protein
VKNESAQGGQQTVVILVISAKKKKQKRIYVLRKSYLHISSAILNR